MSLPIGVLKGLFLMSYLATVSKPYLPNCDQSTFYNLYIILCRPSSLSNLASTLFRFVHFSPGCSSAFCIVLSAFLLLSSTLYTVLVVLRTPDANTRKWRLALSAVSIMMAVLLGKSENYWHVCDIASDTNSILKLNIIFSTNWTFSAKSSPAPVLSMA